MPNIQHQTDQHRFSLSRDNQEIGYLEYRVLGNSWDIVQVRIQPDLRGQGLARRLVDAAIEESAQQGVRLTATCDYAEEVLAREGLL